MTIEKIKDKYSPEVRIDFLEMTINEINNTLSRMEKRFDNIDIEIKNTNKELTNEKKTIHKELRSDIRVNFFWTLGLIFGLYGTAIGTLITAVVKYIH